MIGCELHDKAFTHGCPGCLDYVDELVIAQQVRERLTNDTGERLTLDEFARQLAPHLRAEFARLERRGVV